MRDKRPVDELSIEELERILAIRRREQRQRQLHRLEQQGRRVRLPGPVTAPVQSAPVATAAAAADISPQDSTLAPSPAQDLPEVAPLPPAEPTPVPATVMDDTPRFEDDLPPAQPVGPPRRGQSERSPFMRMVWNRSLLVVEILAVIGVVIIGAQMLQALQLLQEETAAVQAEAQAQAFASLPSPSSTPEISLARIVLPGGHTPPTTGRPSQFNYNEIPEHLRPIVQQQLAAEIIIPTPGPESPVRLEIPAIDVDAPIVIGTHPEALKRGVGHQPGTGQPGRPGNLVLSAHNDIFGQIFRYLDRLEPGDTFTIHTLSQQYTYVIRDHMVVNPNDVWVMDPTSNPTATLISCYPYQVDNQRYVVFAELLDS